MKAQPGSVLQEPPMGSCEYDFSALALSAVARRNAFGSVECREDARG